MSSSSLRRCCLTSIGSSTAQAHLAKIISVIVTVPPIPARTVSVLGNASCADANDISTTPEKVAVNLDLRLGLTLEMSRGSEALATAAEEEDVIPSSHSGVVDSPGQAESGEESTANKVSKKVPAADGSISQTDSASDDFAAEDKSSEGECSRVAAQIKHGAKEISEVTHTSCKEEDGIGGEAEGRVKRGKENEGEGYLDLLLEAARQVSSECGNDVEDEDDDKASPPPQPQPQPQPLPPATSGSETRKRTSSEAELRSKRKRTSSVATAAFNVYEETEPIVRSKRGRSQALPLRYRDSILDPWRKPPTVFRR